jgi:putative transposase
LLDFIDRPRVGKKYRLLDRNTKYCVSPDFHPILAREGIRVIRPPPRSPNLNAHAERWIRRVTNAYQSDSDWTGMLRLRCANMSRIII